MEPDDEILYISHYSPSSNSAKPTFNQIHGLLIADVLARHYRSLNCSTVITTTHMAVDSQLMWTALVRFDLEPDKILFPDDVVLHQIWELFVRRGFIQYWDFCYTLDVSRVAQNCLAMLASGELEVLPESYCNQLKEELIQMMHEGERAITSPCLSYAIDTIHVPGDCSCKVIKWFKTICHNIIPVSTDHCDIETAIRYWNYRRIQITEREFIVPAAIMIALIKNVFAPKLQCKLFCLGSVVWPDEAQGSQAMTCVKPKVATDGITCLTASSLRFYTLEKVRLGSDWIFKFNELEATICTILADQIANLLNRVSVCCNKVSGGKVPSYVNADAVDLPLPYDTGAILATVHQAVETFNLRKYIHVIKLVATATNRFIGTKSPWLKKGQSDSTKRDEVVRVCLEACLLILILMGIVVPDPFNQAFSTMFPGFEINLAVMAAHPSKSVRGFLPSGQQVGTVGALINKSEFGDKAHKKAGKTRSSSAREMSLLSTQPFTGPGPFAAPCVSKDL